MKKFACFSLLILMLTACTMPTKPVAVTEADFKPNVIESVAASASDRNAAIAQLYRWWGLFEAPRDADLTLQLEDLFAENVHVALSGVELNGDDAVKSVIITRPLQGRIAHHLTDVQLSANTDGTFTLDARFIAQVFEAGELRSTPGFYKHTLIKRPDGVLVFSKISAGLASPINLPAFEATYRDNRAKAVIFQFQGVMDSLSDPQPLEELILPDASFAGLVASEQDNDRTPSLKGYDALARWFARGPSVFSNVDHRELEFFHVTPLGDDRYQVIAQYEWVAVTVQGDTHIRHNPRTWILRDDGGKFMKIEALLE